MGWLCYDIRSFRREFPGAFACLAGSLIITVLIVAIVLLATSFHTLKSTEVGVKYDTQERELGGIKGTGLHAGPPFFKFKEYPNVFVTKTIKTLCVSKDGLEVEQTVSFQYRPNRDKLIEISKNYTDASTFDDLIAVAATSSIHHSCGDFEVAEFQSNRSGVQDKMREFISDRFEALSATINSVQLQNVAAPDEWERAVEEKEDAREDISLAKNQRELEITKANTELKLAEEDAKVILQNADNEAQIIITKARSQAAALITKLQTEVNKTRDAMDKLNLTTDAMLRYVMNRNMETRRNLYVNMKPPGTTPRDEL